MKIRFKSNSLRYRLTRSDVAQLTTAGYVDDKVDFGEQSLIYSINRTDADQLSATFKNNIITLFMPANMIIEWLNTDRVGFENNNGPIHLLVEKDFVCLDSVAEDQSDNYPNPLADKKS
jgi:hypothetical protein